MQRVGTLMLLLVCTGVATSLPNTVLAATCTVTSTSVAFGNYNPLTLAARNRAGHIRAACNGTGTLTVALSTGQSNSYNPRYMLSGTTGDQLDYNLYTNVTHTIIFGDGTAGTQTVSMNFANNTVRISVFGQIPAQEDIAPGAYTDSIIASVTF